MGICNVVVLFGGELGDRWHTKQKQQAVVVAITTRERKGERAIKKYRLVSFCNISKNSVSQKSLSVSI